MQAIYDARKYYQLTPTRHKLEAISNNNYLEKTTLTHLDTLASRSYRQYRKDSSPCHVHNNNSINQTITTTSQFQIPQFLLFNLFLIDRIILL